MSFEGFDRRTPSASAPYAARGGVRDGDSEYIRLSQEVKRAIDLLSGNVLNLQKMVGQMGTAQDSPQLQQQFVQRQEAVRKQIGDVEKSIRQLGQFDGGSMSESQSRRSQQELLAKRFQAVLSQFRQCCQTAMSKERSNIQVERTRAASFVEERDRTPSGDRAGLMQGDHMRMEQMHLNQAMIREREEGMKEIEATMSEVNDIFRDLATLVHEQGYQLDNIESNMTLADSHVEKGAGELTKASDYQKKARNKMLCLLVIVAIVAAILIIVLVTTLK